MTRPPTFASLPKLNLALGLGLTVALSGCTDSAEKPSPVATTGFRAKLAYDGEAIDDVVGFHFLVARVECSPGDGTVPNVAEAIVDVLSDSNATGLVSILELFDDGANHRFADLFFYTQAGCYDVTVQPLSVIHPDGSYLPSEVCATARSSAPIVVIPGQTTEIAPLLSQCNGEVGGGGDTPVALNHAPRAWADESENHGYVCEPAQLCVYADDADNDNLEFVWSYVGGPVLFSGPAPQATADIVLSEGRRLWRHCIEFGASTFGHYEFSATVYDLLADGTRVEDALAAQADASSGAAETSHASAQLSQDVAPGDEPFCVNAQGSLSSVDGMGVPSLAGCSSYEIEEFYCDPLNGSLYDFDWFSTCPFGTFNPVAVYPLCEGSCDETTGEGCPCTGADECGDGLVCYFRDGACGGLGVCLEAPQAPVGYINVDQVCSCSGITYPTQDDALAAGQSIRDYGPCPGDETDTTQTDATDATDITDTALDSTQEGSSETTSTESTGGTDLRAWQ